MRQNMVLGKFFKIETFTLNFNFVESAFFFFFNNYIHDFCYIKCHYTFITLSIGFEFCKTKNLSF